MDEDDQPTGKKEYNPIIIEAMNLVIVLKTLCDLEENFKKSLRKNIEKIIEKKKLKQDG